MMNYSFYVLILFSYIGSLRFLFYLLLKIIKKLTVVWIEKSEKYYSFTFSIRVQAAIEFILDIIFVTIDDFVWNASNFDMKEKVHFLTQIKFELYR